ncbi:MAG TPA: twin-arginine translocase TatA/TatE family subunit [Acidimicrobiia bacterium]
MGNIGAPELLIILFVVVLIFGSTQLPKLARSLGQAQKEFKSGLKEGATEDDDGDDSNKGKSSKGKSSK